ncbi:aminotransferase class I/II-fold pyridoxal phosphate-dependent enzyme [Ramlibacter humi]|uniref:Aminotransferase class I/II-fold pyridoxal phosphate-dependent enzyme n=1 Tax=Ramlibacter humi TaxID=2530451 RepID=A0A4Z0BF73_9BURK|nr:aminotransferase class I/II-fold pyridoxal phosphate-dependent enzyme [Ramlibacter humi]
MQPQTQLLHQEHWPTTGFDSVQPGVFRASTVFFPDMAAWRQRDWLSKDRFIYGPHGTPTTFELEARIAHLEGAAHALLCASGLNAIALVHMALLRPGDEVVVPINVYPAHRALLTGELASWGIQVALYDPTDLSTLRIGEATRLVWVEAPCSITMEFPDVPAIAAAARQAGVLTALDNTWGAGVAFCPFDLGIDISAQALTKYANGAGDVVMGSVSVRDKSLYDALKRCSARFGLHVPAGEAEAVLRGLQSLAVRYAAHDRTGRLLARHLAGSGAVVEVLHPALPGACGHEFWQRDCRAAAGIFSVVFDAKYSQQDIDGFIDALQLFRIGFSWGGPVSLVLSYGRDVASLRPLAGELVRFSAGLEAPEDLLDDLSQALALLL